MEILKRLEADALALPLPVFVSIPIADVEKDGERFTVFAGLDKTTTAELKARSLDDSDRDIQQGTSDRKRFGEGSFD
ncbi:MAG: hypothetical protein AAB923_03375, partial [Patescibacteria group bacterium]